MAPAAVLKEAVLQAGFERRRAFADRKTGRNLQVSHSIM